ncbi:hypothetical protein BS297_11945 [Rhodococcus erythropolis]|uniref:Uncharacterized protein n=1 Tax=Rhodococcus erythropolis TaxID=1833 RepID=A0A5N5E7C0_RHOER|nr:hypothetical protein BS297_11945 [Rhodococcus erythropolis]
MRIADTVNLGLARLRDKERTMSPQPIFADGNYRSSDAGVPIRRWCREHLQQWKVPHSLTSFETSAVDKGSPVGRLTCRPKFPW